MIRRIQPILGGSLMVARVVLVRRNPKLGRLGVTASLLAERLRTRHLLRLCGPCTSPVETETLVPVPMPYLFENVEQIDRIWPSERPPERENYGVDPNQPRDIEFVVGRLLDFRV